MKRRMFVMSSLAPIALAACGGGDDDVAQPDPSTTGTRGAALDALKRAAEHMDQNVSYRGGYVWQYLPDLSVSWGEMEAKRSMCWIQPPGTPTAGHAFLDAYHATGNELFYNAAVRTAQALISAQHPAGGWNYIHDFAGEESLKHWYDTIGKNGWRLEEFQHFYGNATFDDAGTAVSSQFLLRVYLEKKDAQFKPAVDKAIDFVLAAQFQGGVADGGWPQRWPVQPAAISSMALPNPGQLPTGAIAGMEDGDYTTMVTFNDDVAGENIKFLLMCVAGLGETRLVAPITRAMECLRTLQQPGPQAGWGLQHLAADRNGRVAGAPAGARSYEPRSLATHTTQTNVQQLFNYFRVTGDRKYLARVPEAIAWLESCKLTAQQIADNPLLAGRTHPTFIELGTNQGRFVHRYGSNIENGAYFHDYDHTNTISHYSAGRPINITGLQATYDQLNGMTDAAIAEMVANSPLKVTTPRPLPKYFSIREVDFADLFTNAVMKTPDVTEAAAKAIIDDLGTKNHWLTPLPQVTNSYRGDGPSTPYTGTAYRSKHVGDVYDTSPYDSLEAPEIAPYTKKDRPLGISTSNWVANMAKLVAYVSPVK
ncbi:pectate lyase [Rhizobacter sp. Root1221]|uniref:pectate lyase n=1 Tax=Rhizobacter sp. Root1221 TaxID=1736433 RepID=UPI0006F4F3AA|nr:pectate lyase [Rhizobacter sp. Root1221]KQV99771.1 pectate lyase [Rhizobacter sp. Root1221]